MESIAAAVAVDTVDVDIVVVVLSAAYHFFAVAVNMDVVAAVALLVAAWAVHCYSAMSIVAVVVAAAHILFDEEAAAAADVAVEEDNPFDFDLLDSVAAYDVSFVAHLHHHLPMANLHHLYSQLHLDIAAVCCSFSVLVNHLVVSCNDFLLCKNVDDYSWVVPKHVRRLLMKEIIVPPL